ncbi:cell division protein FtsQ/DivIB [Propionivibrio dicarboxylicus]|uniref:Cell division protein FtsQ n=1 Tax=Propionivibrio dicarboxylicus TaxID=83767 RepID=A0A1G8FE57_9RHOO|nr:FtsQ-type POTRA domain-containing protein [Propionivibrio dicarboxylicus]SDH80322.1 cell division protein FtsQ [Propionivibrio dicarboxylicus]
MWNKPQLMIAVSDLLWVAGAASLLVSAVVWGARMPWFPLREVVFQSELREVRRNEVERSLAGRLRGNFFSVSLEGVRQALEELPWVRQAEVRRQWPGRLEVTIEEHEPVAFWGQATGQLVNTHGEVFSAVMTVPPATPMPLLVGPPGMAPEMLGYFRLAESIMKPVGRWPKVLNVSARQALQIRLDDGMLVELGRQQAKAPIRQRIERFVEYYPSVLTAARQRPSVVDMRYPNGFALRVNVPAAPLSESKGKQ